MLSNIFKKKQDKEMDIFDEFIKIFKTLYKKLSDKIT